VATTSRASVGGRKAANQPAPAHNVTTQPQLPSASAMASSSRTACGKGSCAPPRERGASSRNQSWRSMSLSCAGAKRPSASASGAASRRTWVSSSVRIINVRVKLVGQAHQFLEDEIRRAPLR